MELYILHLHFVPQGSGLDFMPNFVTASEHFNSLTDAVVWGKLVADRYAVPRCKCWYIKGPDGKIYTDQPDEIRKLIGPAVDIFYDEILPLSAAL